uniref:Uncharacterized protein n=1 Tax=Triticum urartu TaxID=4572 RepID=A0A8R7TJ06_TRIUA
MRRRRPPTGSVPPPPPRSYAAGWDPASRIHVPASPSTLSAACTRRNTSRLPTSLPTLPSPQPRITPAGIHRAVHLVRACSPSLSARLTAEQIVLPNLQKELLIFMSEVQLYHGDAVQKH